MIKGIILLADGFETVEALMSYDLFLRAGMSVDLLSISDNLSVNASNGLKVASNGLLKDNLDKLSTYDFIVLPGGKRGTDNLTMSSLVEKALKIMSENDKLLAAICAAPSVLLKYGYLKGLEYTCFPGFENPHECIYKEDKTVVVTPKIITGRSMYWTADFAEAIIKHFLGEEGLRRIYKGTRGVR